MANERSDWQRFKEELLQRLNFVDFYTNYDLDPSPAPNASGWHYCKAVDGTDATRSASFHQHTGYYQDFKTGESYSPWEFMVIKGDAKDWREAQLKIAHELGIKPPKIGRTHPENGVEWQKWDDIQTKTYCKLKAPITSLGLKRSGARMCVRFDVACFAWPIYDVKLEILGWHYTPRNGLPFPNKTDKGAKAITKKYDGADAGLIGTPAAVWLAQHHDLAQSASQESNDRHVYWVEGAPDMVAGYSLMPEGLWVTNPHGCGEYLSSVQHQFFQSGNVYAHLIADADVPGIAGAFKRRDEMQKIKHLRSVRVYIPPGFAVDQKHGKDLRDYFADASGKGIKIDYDPTFYTHLVEQDDPNKIAEIKGKSVQQQEEKSKTQVEFSIRLIEEVGIQVLSKSPSGELLLFSTAFQQLRSVRNLADIRYEDMAVFVGRNFTSDIVRSKADAKDKKNVIAYAQFLDHIAKASIKVACTNSAPVGAGIWQLCDNENEATDELLIVQRGECHVVRNGSLTKCTKPVHGSITADLTCSEQWYDPEVLADLLPRALDPEWRLNVYRELLAHFRSWHWAYEDMSRVACGLYLSTFLQTLFTWRPIITVVGESNSGKTYLMGMLEDLYLGLANSSSGSTWAGIKQSIKFNGSPLLLDEFDSISAIEQSKCLCGFRVASRGQKTLQGTSNHQGVRYEIRHMPWICGIFAASYAQADTNRMIELQLRPTPEFTIQRPTASQAKDLGHRVLAGVLATAQTAADMANELAKTVLGAKIHTRYVESYAVPFATIGAFVGVGIEDTQASMIDYFQKHLFNQIAHSETQTDQENALMEIMTAEVRLPSGAPLPSTTVANLLFDDRLSIFSDVLENKGVTVVSVRKSLPRVAFVSSMITRSPSGLLAQSVKWRNNAGLKSVIERLNGGLDPRQEVIRVGGLQTRAVTIDFEELKKWARNSGEKTLF